MGNLELKKDFLYHWVDVMHLQSVLVFPFVLFRTQNAK